MVLVQDDLSRRERQVLSVLYELGSATAEQVRSKLVDELSNSAVRTMLRSLERKGHVRHRKDGPRFLFMPVVERTEARKSALNELLNVFFKGNPDQAFEALLDLKADKLKTKDYDRLAELIEAARRKES